MTDREPLLGVAGLSPTSERIYITVVETGFTTESEISSLYDLSLDEASRHLEEIASLGLVTWSRTDRTYRPVDPRVALSAIAERAAAQARGIQARIPDLAELYARTLDRGQTSGLTQILTSPGEIAGWYVRLQHQAKKELLEFDQPPYYATHLEPVEMRMLDRGVSWRSIYTPESFTKPGAWEHTAHLAELGEQGRIVSRLPAKLAIADRRVAIVALTPDRGRPEILVTESPVLVEMFYAPFEVLWHRGMPLNAETSQAPPVVAPDAEAVERVRSAPDGAGPSAEQRAILAMIGGGMTDEAIAQRLGLSIRTLRRRVQEIMTSLGADSRFQLGVAAVRRGWL